MNWLLEQLPDKVLVNGVEYLINADFRTIILIDQIMHDKELSDTDRILSALNIFYMEKAPEQTTQAIEKLGSFVVEKSKTSRKSAEDIFRDVPE